jgi:hypothetical protein
VPVVAEDCLDACLAVRRFVRAVYLRIPIDRLSMQTSRMFGGRASLSAVVSADAAVRYSDV